MLTIQASNYGAALSARAEPRVLHQNDIRVDSEDALRNAMGVVVRWALADGSIEKGCDLLSFLAQESDLPPDVQVACDLVRSTRIQTLAFGDQVNGVDDAIEMLELAVPHPRDALVFWDRTSRNPSTLDEIGARLRVSRERVRQRQTRAANAVATALTDRKCEVLRWRFWRVGWELGRAAPLDALWVQEIFNRLLDGIPDSWQERIWSLALRHSGPYGQDGAGWVVRGELLVPTQVTEGSKNLDGSIDLVAVRSRLAEAGVVPRAQDAWLMRYIPTREIDGKVYAWDGSIMDKAFILLSARGGAMTVDEIVNSVDEGHSPRATRIRLLGDHRFMRVDQYRMAVRDPEIEEYTGIVDEIEQEVTRHGGEAKTSDIVAILTAAFSVSPSSVIALTGSPRFVTANGRVRLRRPDEPYKPRRGITDEPGCYLESEDNCNFRLRVTADLLRGSGVPIPEGLGAWLGVLPLLRREIVFNNSDPVPITWPDSSIQGPSIGSLRKVIVSQEAASGDFLFIRFDRKLGTADTEVLKFDRHNQSTGVNRLNLLTGLSEPDSSRLRSQLAVAIGTNISGLRSQLYKRGEEEFLALLSEEAAHNLDDALERLRDVF